MAAPKNGLAGLLWLLWMAYKRWNNNTSKKSLSKTYLRPTAGIPVHQNIFLKHMHSYRACPWPHAYIHSRQTKPNQKGRITSAPPSLGTRDATVGYSELQAWVITWFPGDAIMLPRPDSSFCVKSQRNKNCVVQKKTDSNAKEHFLLLFRIWIHLDELKQEKETFWCKKLM